MAARRRAAQPAEAIEELDDLEEITDDAGDDDLEELTEEEPAPTPAKRTRAKAAPAKATKTAPTKAATKAAPASDRSEFDSNWLAAHVTEETGIEYDGRAVRMLLRKLAKDGHLAREIGTDRSRYDFPRGANDPTVKAVIKLIKSGEAKAVAQEGLAEAKASKAAKAAPAKKAAAPAKTAPAKAAPARRRRTSVSE
jgi:hypothetical protein